MSAAQSSPWFHSNRCAEEATCEFCGGLIRHEAWCIIRNPQVMAAWEAVADPSKLDLHDHLILHALGVSWRAGCKGASQSQTGAASRTPAENR